MGKRKGQSTMDCCKDSLTVGSWSTNLENCHTSMVCVLEGLREQDTSFRVLSLKGFTWSLNPSHG